MSNEINKMAKQAKFVSGDAEEPMHKAEEEWEYGNSWKKIA